MSTYEFDGEFRGLRFRTLNGGRDWEPVADDFGTAARRDVIGSLHYDPATQWLYAGLGLVVVGIMRAVPHLR